MSNFTFDAGTNDTVKAKLTSLHKTRDRVRIVYGDPITGKDWLEEYDVMGRIGRSTGQKPIALLVNNERSMGGGAILTANILKIVLVDNKKVLYQHEKYEEPVFEIGFLSITGQYSVSVGGKVQANFKTQEAATKYIDFMLCKRMRKF